MSYYATFKPTEEAVEKIKSQITDQEKEKKWISDMEYRILIKCMTGNNGKDVQKTIDELRFDLNYLERCANSLSRNASYRQFKEENEIWFCGWDYSRPYDAPDMSETEENVLKNLLIETFIIKTPEYVGNEEIFYEKIGRITELVEYFVETAEKSADFEIMDELKEFRVSDEDKIKDELKEFMVSDEDEIKENADGENKGTVSEGDTDSSSSIESATKTDSNESDSMTKDVLPRQVPLFVQV